MLTRTQMQELKRTPLRHAPNKIAVAMKLTGCTQTDIADATGFAQTYISRIKNGRYSKLPGETMRELADFFGCSIEDLFPSREAVSA